MQQNYSEHVHSIERHCSDTYRIKKLQRENSITKGACLCNNRPERWTTWIYTKMQRRFSLWSKEKLLHPKRTWSFKILREKYTIKRERNKENVLQVYKHHICWINQLKFKLNPSDCNCSSHKFSVQKWSPWIVKWGNSNRLKNLD